MPAFRKAHLLAASITAILFGLSGALAGVETAPGLKDKTVLWEQAFNEGNQVLGGSLYTENAILMPPNSPPVEGRTAIAKTFLGSDAMGATLKLKMIDATISGDIAYVTGNYWMTTPDGVVVDDGKYVEVRKRVGDDYLIHRDIYNSNRPAVPADMGSTAAAVATFVEVWNDKDYSKLDAIIAPEFKRRAPGGTSDADGLAGLKKVMQTLHAAYPDMAISADQVDYYNGGGVVHWTFTGTNTGPGDEPPTGKAVEISGLTTLTMVDGKIAGEYVKFDGLSWQLQLGKTLQ